MAHLRKTDGKVHLIDGVYMTTDITGTPIFVHMHETAHQYRITLDDYCDILNSKQHYMGNQHILSHTDVGSIFIHLRKAETDLRDYYEDTTLNVDGDYYCYVSKDLDSTTVRPITDSTFVLDYYTAPGSYLGHDSMHCTDVFTLYEVD